MKFRFGLVCLVVMLLTGTFSLDTYASDETVCSVNLLHTHSGSSSSGGGCYTVAKTEPYSYEISWSFAASPGEWTCYKCGKTNSTSTKRNYADGAFQWSGTCSHCHSSSTGGTAGGPPRYASGTRTYYDLGCGLSENQVVGTVSVTKQVNSSYTLTPQLTDSSSGASITSYSWSNGDTGTCTVTGDGTYTLTVNWSDNGAERVATTSYVVSDYDKTPPVVVSVTSTPSNRTNQDVSVEVSATDNMGIDAYSFDGQASWQQSNTYVTDVNKSVSVYVRDIAGNISSETVFIVSNIDKASPVVTECNLVY